MTSPPLISIVVPTHGRPEALTRCLDAIRRLEYPVDRFEVVVVDDGSPDPVNAGCPPMTRVRVLRQQRAGPAAARNTGARAATHDFLAFTDDDCRPDPAWLQGLAGAFARDPDTAVGGSVANALPGNTRAESSQLLVSFLCEYYNTDPERARFFTSNNLAFPRDAFLAVGGFDTRYQRAAGEDRELCDRWVSSGRRLVWARDAIVHHAHDLTLRGFVRQHYSYGGGAWGYRRARAARRAAPVEIEPLRFYAGLIGYPFRVHGVRGVRHSLLLTVAQAANAVGFLAHAMRSGLDQV